MFNLVNQRIGISNEYFSNFSLIIGILRANYSALKHITILNYTFIYKILNVWRLVLNPIFWLLLLCAQMSLKVLTHCLKLLFELIRVKFFRDIILLNLIKCWCLKLGNRGIIFCAISRRMIFRGRSRIIGFIIRRDLRCVLLIAKQVCIFRQALSVLTQLSFNQTRRLFITRKLFNVLPLRLKGGAGTLVEQIFLNRVFVYFVHI